MSKSCSFFPLLQNNYNISDCNCNPDGSESLTCDAESGKCHCKCDVEGDKCDACTSGHHGFPECHGNTFTFFNLLCFNFQQKLSFSLHYYCRNFCSVNYTALLKLIYEVLAARVAETSPRIPRRGALHRNAVATRPLHGSFSGATVCSVVPCLRSE